MHCPICQSPSRPLFQKYGYAILHCQTCHHQFVDIDRSEQHAAQVYDDSYFHGGGAGYPNYLSEAKLLRSHGRRYARLLKRYMDVGTVLDVGAAAGFILQGFVDLGWQGCGIEPNAQMAAHARQELGLAVNAGTLEQLHDGDRYDLISMIQVVAHFFDLQKAFHVAATMTKPQGYWLIETWNRDSFTAKIFGQHWHEYSPPSVLHWFTPDSIKQLGAQFGFYEVARGRPAKWIEGAHVKSLLRYKLERSRLGKLISKLLGIIPDNLVIPYPAEDLFWILLQKSETIQPS
jgi:2-polyprenyl-3-methyl-5-hydroxy-6-metoxy-1,4-benzoquinol methylase